MGGAIHAVQSGCARGQERGVCSTSLLETSYDLSKAVPAVFGWEARVIFIHQACKIATKSFTCRKRFAYETIYTRKFLLGLRNRIKNHFFFKIGFCYEEGHAKKIKSQMQSGLFRPWHSKQKKAVQQKRWG